MKRDIVNKLNSASKLVEIEDIYRPFKEKKKTKATDAINNGLEPLAKIIMSFKVNGSIEEVAKKYVTDKVKSVSDAITGAKYIIAEWISDNSSFRKQIRYLTFNNGILTSKKKKNAIDDNKIYEMYYDFKEPVKYIKMYRVLAINRGENEDILNVNIDIDDSIIINYLNEKVIKDSTNNELVTIVKESIIDSYNRLIKPSIEREIRSDLTEMGENAAIENFSKISWNIHSTSYDKKDRSF